LDDDLLAEREYFFDHFTALDAHFLWCCRRATQLKVDISGFPNVAAHFKRTQERPSVHAPRTDSIKDRGRVRTMCGTGRRATSTQGTY
jgi:glutathione S-transferase